MAKEYAVGEAIEVTYQAAGAGSGKTIEMEVYDEAGILDGFQTVAAMTEIGTKGRYKASFTPDAEGTWVILMEDSVAGTGKVVRQYDDAGYTVDSVGDLSTLIKIATDNLPADPADQSDVETAISASEVTIIAEIDELESPAMVG